MMDIKTLEPILAAHPFFKDFYAPYIELLTECASIAVFQPNEYIWRVGEEVTRFYLIRHGEVAVEISAAPKNHVITTVGEGEVIGWSWLVPPYRAHNSVRSIGLTRHIALDVICLRRKMESDPELGYQMMRRFVEIIIRRFEATQLQLIDVYN
jgi:CRP-like cAMP-binding protein